MIFKINDNAGTIPNIILCESRAKKEVAVAVAVAVAGGRSKGPEPRAKKNTVRWKNCRKQTEFDRFGLGLAAKWPEFTPAYPGSWFLYLDSFYGLFKATGKTFPLKKRWPVKAKSAINLPISKAITGD